MSQPPREAHVTATHTAIQAVGECQTMIAALREQVETTTGLVAQATGGMACSAESGRNAFEFQAALVDVIDELYEHSGRVVAELERYAGGF